MTEAEMQRVDAFYGAGKGRRVEQTARLLRELWVGVLNVENVFVSMHGTGWRGNTPVINFVVSKKDPAANYPKNVDVDGLAVIVLVHERKQKP